LLFNKKTEPSDQLFIYKEIVNTAHRKDYIVNDFIPRLLKKLGLIAFRDALHQDAKCHGIMNEIFIHWCFLIAYFFDILFFSVPSELH
jgi:hypothetical protein